MDKDQRMRLSQALHQFREMGDERAELLEQRLAAVGGPASRGEIRTWLWNKQTRHRQRDAKDRHEDAKRYVNDPDRLREECGEHTISFQVYRADLNAVSSQALQGKMLAEVLYPGAAVTDTDSVSTVEQLFRLCLKDLEVAQPTLRLTDDERVTLFLNGRPMVSDSLFYAENFIRTPVWIQCCVHACTRKVLLECLASLSTG